ncbi:unnamed protein product [Nyctereutes procyonoides]|uniref:RNA transcription, translation and transport factor protein n=1 Tax=Nyctereutes procyonoides TaxID=34880 RepID=A0A811XZI0_NYCPR|nr:unnamed protein product [Nyctereutes procyonoides]
MFQGKLMMALDYHSPAGFNCRGILRNIHSSDWPKFFEKYLRDANCPFKIQGRQETINWLLGLADLVRDNNQNGNVEAFINLDPCWCPNNPDFKAGLMALAKLLQVNGLPMALDKHVLGFDTLRELQTKIHEAVVAVQTVTADPKTDHRLGNILGFQLRTYLVQLGTKHDLACVQKSNVTFLREESQKINYILGIYHNCFSLIKSREAVGWDRVGNEQLSSGFSTLVHIFFSGN